MALAYTAELLRAMQEPLRAELAERKLWYFVREMWPILEPGTPFVDSWHIGCVAEHLEALSSLEIKKLVLNLPRRRGKSILSAVGWFCWSWIKNPWERWSYISYGADLSERDSKKCGTVLTSPWYQRWWGDRFKLKQSTPAASRFENDKQGYRLATSVGGKTIGWGGEYNIADDIVDFKDAFSPSLLKKASDIWTQGVHQSVNDPKKARFLIVQQRLNEIDLAGVVMREDYGYETLILPEEYEPCRVFFTKEEAKRSTERHPIVMTKLQRERPTVKYGSKEFKLRDPRTTEGELISPDRFPRAEVEADKKLLGAYGTAAQKQQRPAPVEGTIFKLNMFRYFREEWRDSGKVFVLKWTDGADLKTRIIPIEHCRFFQTIDTAMEIKSTNDYTAIGTWILTPHSDLLLYHMYRVRIEIPYQFALLESFRKGRSIWREESREVLTLQEWPRQLMFQAVEKAVSGYGLIQQGQASGIPFKPLTADKTPMLRIAPIASMYSSGQVYHQEGAAWLPDYEGEMLGFPGGHDDMLMTAAYAGYLAQHDVILRTGLSRPLTVSDEATTREAERLSGIEDDNKVKLSIGGVDVEFDFDD